MPSAKGFQTREDRRANWERLGAIFDAIDCPVQDILQDFLAASELGDAYQVAASRPDLAWMVSAINPADQNPDAPLFEAVLTLLLTLGGPERVPWLLLEVQEAASAVPVNVALLPDILYRLTSTPVQAAFPHKVHDYLQSRSWKWERWN
jgi:hypothetical protein